jgi:heme-degrading monooxygenase HmoA
MHARVTQITGSPDAADEGIANFRDETLPALRDIDGNKGALLLIDRTSGKGIAVTLWESEEAMRASEESVKSMRAQAAETLGATGTPSVDRYEVAVFET